MAVPEEIWSCIWWYCVTAKLLPDAACRFGKVQRFVHQWGNDTHHGQSPCWQRHWLGSKRWLLNLPPLCSPPTPKNPILCNYSDGWNSETGNNFNQVTDTVILFWGRAKCRIGKVSSLFSNFPLCTLHSSAPTYKNLENGKRWSCYRTVLLHFWTICNSQI